MRIVIIATGVWGDVRPNVVLGQALQKAGYEVLLVATAPYREWIEARGLSYAGVSLDMQGMLDLVMGGEGGLLYSIQALNAVRKNVLPTFMQAGKEIAALMREGDVLVADELVSFLLNGVVEKYKPHLIHVNMAPQAITSQFPATGSRLCLTGCPCGVPTIVCLMAFSGAQRGQCRVRLVIKSVQPISVYPNKHGRSRRCC